MSFAEDGGQGCYGSDCMRFSVEVGGTGPPRTTAASDLKMPNWSKGGGSKLVGTSFAVDSVLSSRGANSKTAASKTRKQIALRSLQVSPKRNQMLCQAPPQIKKFSAQPILIYSDLDIIHRKIDIGEIKLDMNKEGPGE